MLRIIKRVIDVFQFSWIGIPIGILFWLLLYLSPSLIPERIANESKRQHDTLVTTRTVDGGKTVAEVRQVRFGEQEIQIDSLSDPYNSILADMSYVKFNDGKIEEAKAIVRRSRSSSDQDDILLSVALRLISSGPALKQPPMSMNDINQELLNLKENLEGNIEGKNGKMSDDEAKKKLMELESKLESKLLDQNKNNHEIDKMFYKLIFDVAMLITNPLSRAIALDKLHSMILMQSEYDFDVEDNEINKKTRNENKEFASMVAGESLSALNAERKYRESQIHNFTIPVRWVGPFIFAIIGFVIISFIKPVIEAFGKSLGDAMVKDANPVILYQNLIKHASEMSRNVEDLANKGKLNSDDETLLKPTE